MDRNESFSYEGKRVLFDHLENMSEETSKDIELDVIAICCDYNEDTIEDIINNHSIDVSEADGDEDEQTEIVREYLNEHTFIVGEVPGGFVYSVF